MDKELFESTLDIPKFTLRNQIFTAKCVKCYDGDTVHVNIRLYNTLYKFICRLANIDTAELRSKNPKEKNHAQKAKKWLENLILNKIIKIKCGNFDKYGRLLIFIYLNDENMEFKNSVNNLLIENNFAYKYDGGKKKKFDEWFILNQ